MNLAVKVFVLSLLVRLLLSKEQPWLCATLYAVTAFSVELVFGLGVSAAVWSGVFGFAAAVAYFWVLNRMETGSIGWWTIAVFGVPMVFL